MNIQGREGGGEAKKKSYRPRFRSYAYILYGVRVLYKHALHKNGHPRLQSAMLSL